MDQKTVEGRRLSGQNTSRLRATQNDPSGLSRVEAFGNSLAGSVNFCFPSWQSLGRSLSFQQRRQSLVSPLLGNCEAKQTDYSQPPKNFC